MEKECSEVPGEAKQFWEWLKTCKQLTSGNFWTGQREETWTFSRGDLELEKTAHSDCTTRLTQPCRHAARSGENIVERENVTLLPAAPCQHLIHMHWELSGEERIRCLYAGDSGKRQSSTIPYYHHSWRDLWRRVINVPTGHHKSIADNNFDIKQYIQYSGSTLTSTSMSMNRMVVQFIFCTLKIHTLTQSTHVYIYGYHYLSLFQMPFKTPAPIHVFHRPVLNFIFFSSLIDFYFTTTYIIITFIIFLLPATLFDSVQLSTLSYNFCHFFCLLRCCKSKKSLKL